MSTLKEQIEEARLERDRAEKRYGMLRAQCKHPEIVSSDGTDEGGAVCRICHRDFGWYCPTSPTKSCSYKAGCYGCCDYCGNPEERK